MSGRKSTEVAAVLKQGESVRKMTDGIFSREIQRAYEKYLQSLNLEQAIKNSPVQEIELDGAAVEMFGAEGKKLSEELKTLKKNLRAESVTDKGKNIVGKLKNLDRELEAADREAASIRAAIRNKDWYCDEEYARAEDLVYRYQNLRDERASLERRMKSLQMQERQNLTAMQSKSDRLKNLISQMENMNNTAKKRVEADGYRRELENALNSTDAKSAEKFFADEFSKLKAKTSELKNSSDDKVLKNFQENYTAIINFQKQVAERLALWKKQKADAEEMFAQMEQAAGESFIEPIEYYNEGENGRRMKLFAYLKKYGGKDFSDEFFKQHDLAAKFIREEKFLESLDAMKAGIDIAEKARQDGLILQESMLKKTELAGAIQDVMTELRYDTNLEIINDNPHDGFKITCKVGDETIDFEKVDIDDDGKVKIDVNHQEGRGGNCANSWKTIAARLQDIGIPVTDVKLAGGRSVLRPAVVSTPDKPGKKVEVSGR